MTDSDTTEKKTKKKRPAPPHAFKPGAEWTGNRAGRPKGSRNKLSEDFVSELAAKFERQGPSAIDRVIEENPAKFLQMVADLVPKEFDIKHDAGDAFLQLWQTMAGGKPKGD
jgi:hypothetical protein